jgi:hypothetical protein
LFVPARFLRSRCLRLPESWSLGQRPCGPLARLARLARRVRSHDRAGGSDGRTAPSQVGSALKACPALRAEPEIGKDAMTVYMVPQVQVQDQEHLGARQGDRRAGDRPVRRALPHARRQPRSGRSGLDPAGRPAGQHRRVPSLEQAHAWYDSPEYAKALAFRKVAVPRRLFFVQGADRLPAASGRGRALRPGGVA